MLQLGQHRPRWQDGDPGGGELDGQRQAVQPATNLGGYRDVCLGEAVASPSGRCREQSNRLEPGQDVGRRKVAGIGQGERRHWEGVFAGEAQDDAAGDEQAEAGRVGEEIAEHNRGREDLLGIVEHQEEATLAEVPLQAVEQRSGALLPHPEGLRDRRRDEVGIADSGEGDEDDAVAERVPCTG